MDEDTEGQRDIGTLLAAQLVPISRNLNPGSSDFRCVLYITGLYSHDACLIILYTRNIYYINIVASYLANFWIIR